MIKKSFTLAEVLITLGIIGIVAAMTLPPFIQRQQEKIVIARLKKAYSSISQAYLMAVNEHGSPENWDLVGSRSRAGALNMLNILTPYIKTTKICDVTRDCFPNVRYKTLSPQVLAENYNQNAATADAKLADGSLINTYIFSEKCEYIRSPSKALQHICGAIGIDINGFQKPNQIGVDFFYFWITSHGIVPYGTSELRTVPSFDGWCRDKDKVPDSASYNGSGCTAWVIYNENMDYLHCKDLSWSGKRKCSD